MMTENNDNILTENTSKKSSTLFDLILFTYEMSKRAKVFWKSLQ